MTGKFNEFLSLNKQRRYPFSESSLLMDIFVDAAIVVPSTFSLPLHIDRIHRAGTIVSVCVKDTLDNLVGIASGVVDAELEYNSINFIDLGNFVSGVLTIYRFPQHGILQDDSEFLLCVTTLLQYSGVTGIVIEDKTITGDIIVEAGTGMKIVTDEDSVTFTATNPEAFIPECSQ